MEGKGKESEEWDSSVSSSFTGAVYNYVVTAQKPTAVSHSVVGNFSDANGKSLSRKVNFLIFSIELDLIVCKNNIIEVSRLTPSGLVFSAFFSSFFNSFIRIRTSL